MPRGSAEAVIGCRFDGRRRAELAGSVGPLDAALPVHVSCQATEPFESAARRLEATLAKAASLQDWAWAADAVQEKVPAIGIACFVSPRS